MEGEEVAEEWVVAVAEDVVVGEKVALQKSVSLVVRRDCPQWWRGAEEGVAAD